MVLLKMKETAEAYLGTKVNDAAVASAVCKSEMLVHMLDGRIEVEVHSMSLDII